MANEELEKLKQRVEKDPLSKLFVPLAEEYRKMGMLDEALSVLLRGLENQPNYMTARVSLGKVYLEKNMLREAKEEFKKVVNAIPDNLFALKKIAEISEKLGDINDAIDAYTKIVKLNPMDDEAKSALENLKQKSVPEVTDKVGTESLESPTVTLAINSSTHEMLQPSLESPESEKQPEESEHFNLEGFMPLTETSYSDEEFERFKQEIISKNAPAEEVPLHSTPIQDSSRSLETPEEENHVQPEEKTSDEVEIYEQAGEITLQEEISVEDTFFVEAPEDITVEKTPPSRSIEIPIIESAREEGTETPEREPDFSYPDRLIQQGNYIKAIEAYKKLLNDFPGDKRVLQRMEELKFLLKLLGKEKEIIVDQLNKFLEAIKNRYQKR
jgi:tetratricopeptide (TPR) repeat protein